MGHQCSQAPGRPILHLVSSSRRPRRVTGVAATSSVAPHLAQFLCSCLRPAVASSRPAWPEAPCARDRQGWPSHLPCLVLGAPARPSSRSGRCLIRPDAFEVALLVENGPRDTGKFVGERDCQHVVVQPLLGGFDPGLEPVALPGLRSDQHDPGRLHENRTRR